MNRFLVKQAIKSIPKINILHDLHIQSSRNFATKFGRKPTKKIVIKEKVVATAQKPVEEAWVSVKDEASGQIYWWNQVTNETTALGEPKPIGATRAVQAYAVPPPMAPLAQGKYKNILII